MLLLNHRNRGGTASFKSSVDRQRNSSLIPKQIAPPIGVYEADFEKIQPSRFRDLKLDKQEGRVDK